MARARKTLCIGVDAGGTFTDFVVARPDGGLEVFKLRSNPASPASVILAGIEKAAGGGPAEIVHGSTVATNALLERKGARTAFVTTAGFEDLAHIGRQNRRELYNLTPAPLRRLIPRSACFGVIERTLFDGSILTPPDKTSLDAVARALDEFDSVAICFLHADQNSENERVVESALAGALGSRVSISRSSEVSPEFREYERASTTLLNAYVRPLMDSYLAELEAGGRAISILQSNGGAMTTSEARQYAVRTLLSGPAGGVVGALATARLSGFDRILGFDMGGTSTDVSLCQGSPRETTEGSLEGFPIRVPMLDIHTVGAGGGSLARVDEGGLLRVGPESAGADPGPACYGRGEQATVTDAHVVLGRIAPDQLAGGEMLIDPERSAAAVDRIGAQLGMDRVTAARGILRVANANMERAIRAVSVERGYDARDFALVAFGGAGGLHACDIAAELGISTVLVPGHAGALSALGMLLADRVRDYAAGALGRSDIEDRFRELEARAAADLHGARLERSADIRYAGQSYELNVPWRPHDPGTPFHVAHQKMYGYSDPRRAVEVVTIRVRARKKQAAIPIPAVHRTLHSEPGLRDIFLERWQEMPVYHREQAPPRAAAGPALVIDYGSTTLVPGGWNFFVDAHRNLVISCARRR